MADTMKIIKCPACGEEMEKIFVDTAGVHVDICTKGCGGIFFDNREFKKFDEKAENIDAIKKALEGKTFKTVDASFKRICPACGMKMMKNSTSIKGDVIIDECYACGGKFLDYGELDKIREEYDTEDDRSKAVVDYLRNAMGAEFDEMHIQAKIPKKKRGIISNIIDKFF